MLRKKKFKIIGKSLILLSILTAVLTFGKVYFERFWWESTPQEYKSRMSVSLSDRAEAEKPFKPKSEEFGLVIPKLNINAPVSENVSYLNQKEYDAKLQIGVAHQKGTPAPDKAGNTVIFGHSSAVPWLGPSDYSEIFLMLDKLEPEDEIDVWYSGKKSAYKVQQVKQISAIDLSIIRNTKDKRLTLYTCWPPGTNIRRLAVIAVAK